MRKKRKIVISIVIFAFLSIAILLPAFAYAQDRMDDTYGIVETSEEFPEIQVMITPLPNKE